MFLIRNVIFFTFYGRIKNYANTLLPASTASAMSIPT